MSHILLTDELHALNKRVTELRSIVTSLTLLEACASLAYSHYEQSNNFRTLDSLKDTLYQYAIAHKNKRHIVKFDDDVQEEAFRVLEKCYDLRCNFEHGYLLGDGDITAGLVVATGCTSDVAERFFNQHYTKQGVVR